MDITVISDLHGHYPELEGGDLLIVAGDLTGRDTELEYLRFFEWLTLHKYRKIIFIAGNHDNYLQAYKPTYANHIQYLCDSGTEFEGLRIWGSPWTLKFEGMNKHCTAFTCDTEEELAEKWALIPDDIDILVTHSPPHGVLDQVEKYSCAVNYKLSVGSKTLRRQMGRIKPRLWVVGHIHEGYGEFKDTTLSGQEYHFVNASIMNEYYDPVNKPVRIEI